MARRDRLHSWLLAAALVIALIIVSIAALAHSPGPDYSWVYPSECCGNRDEEDCTPIDSRAVKISSEGYIVRAGGKDFLVRFEATRVSPDGRYHICIAPKSKLFRCFFAPRLTG
jgi:hypothetical protein